MEGLYPLIGVFIGMCIALGYDAIVGIVISAVAAVIGFNVGGISFYNTGIAQTVSGLPLFSGLGLPSHCSCNYSCYLDRLHTRILPQD